MGAQGAQGDIGAQGAQGASPTGAQGAQGASPTGAQGAQGADALGTTIGGGYNPLVYNTNLGALTFVDGFGNEFVLHMYVSGSY